LKESTSGDMTVVGSFPKNAFEEVYAYFAPYNGQLLAHVRVFVSDDEDTMHPTKKGIAVRLGALPKLAELVETLLRSAPQPDMADADSAAADEELSAAA
jgi:hypothetical protein